MKRRGFTVMELMIILGLIAMVSAIAYPKISDSLRKGRAREGAKGLVNAVLVARSESMIRNAYHLITLRASASTGASDPVAGGGSVTVQRTAGAGCTGATLDIETFNFAGLVDVNLCMVKTSAAGLVAPGSPCAESTTRLCANPDGSITNLDVSNTGFTLAYVRENDGQSGIGVVRQVVIPRRKAPRLLPVQVVDDACL